MKRLLTFLFAAGLVSTSWAIDSPPGYFNDGVNIFPAPPGKFVPVANATSATDCPPGYYTPVAGMREAIPASPGYFVPVAGSSSQTPAPAGSYASGVASTSATLCGPGF